MNLRSTARNKIREEGIVPLLILGISWGYTTAKSFTREQFRPWRYRLNGYSAPPDPGKRLFVDPRDIRYRILEESPVYREDNRENYGKVRGGDWDRKRNRLETIPKYQACKKRVEDIPWRETGIIDKYVEYLEGRDGSIDGCYTREDVIELYEKRRERLYRSIKTNGFDTDISDKCCDVHIGRDGELIFARQGGTHRLSLSRLLGVDEVPVRVVYRHKSWQEVREEIGQAERYNELSEKAKRHVHHPDVEGLTVGLCEASRAGGIA